MKLQQPWPDGHKIRSPFGFRKHPITGVRQLHRGVDVGGSFPVHAAADGVVAHVGFSKNGGGHVVILDHGDIHTVYYHGAHATEWKRGQRINAGDFIYQSGSTGASTGNHLHFEVRKSRAFGTQVDPEPYFAGQVTPPVLPGTGTLTADVWRVWQTQLKNAGLYSGRIDGKRGPMTIRAIEQFVGEPADGILDNKTMIAVQQLLTDWGFYSGKLDGVWGRQTNSGLQRSLNEGKWNDRR